MSTGILEKTIRLIRETEDRSSNSPSNVHVGEERVPYPVSDRFNVSAIELYNSYISLLVVPELCGHILAIKDLRSGHGLWTPNEGGQGLLLDLPEEREWSAIGQGAQFLVEGRHNSRDSMDPPDVRIREADEAGPAVMVHQVVSYGDLSWMGWIELSKDAPTFALRMRVQNRLLSPRESKSGVRFFGGLEAETFGPTMLLSQGDCKVAVTASPLLSYSAEPVNIRFSNDHECAEWANHDALWARQIREWSVEGHVFTTQSKVFAVNSSAYAGRTEEGLEIGTSLQAPLAKIFLSAGGQTLESSASLYPEHASQFNGVPAEFTDLALRSSSGDILLAWSESQGEPETLTRLDSTLEYLDVREAKERQLEVYADDPRTKAAASIRRAELAMQAQDWESADRHLEDALGANAEDGLAWWLKAVVGRYSGAEGERTDLLNSHYLSPMEPILRAESILSTPVIEGKDPHPMAAKLAPQKNAVYGILEMLIEAGLDQDANRLGTEVLRVQEDPWIYCILAARLLERTRMKATAAEYVAKAAKCEIWSRPSVGIIERSIAVLDNEYGTSWNPTYNSFR